jgi:hypothetical protein
LLVTVKRVRADSANPEQVKMVQGPDADEKQNQAPPAATTRAHFSTLDAKMFSTPRELARIPEATVTFSSFV